MNQDEQTALRELFLEKVIREARNQRLRERLSRITDQNPSLEEGKEDGLIGKVNTNFGDVIGRMDDGLQKFNEEL